MIEDITDIAIEDMDLDQLAAFFEAGFGEALELHMWLSVWFSGAVIPAASC